MSDYASALARSDRLHDRHDIECAIARMAVEIRNDYAGSVPVYLPVMHGGMLFASLLALELRIDLEFDYVHATRYRGETSGGALAWLHRPAVSLRDRRVLLVDDILDEGHTLAAVRQWCREGGARDVRIAAMTRKVHDRCVPGLAADYIGLDVPDRYVFGFGMDYHGHGRNLPAIHAL